MTRPATSTPYPPGKTHTIPARTSAAVTLSPSQTITIINTHGTQVVDFWAFEAPSPPSTTLTSHLSTSHTRAATLRLSPTQGSTLYTNRRAPILHFETDTSPGVHDTLIPACDVVRYRQLGVPESTYHANCIDNLHAALTQDTRYALPSDATPPDPLNLFMNIPVIAAIAAADPSGVNGHATAGAELRFESPLCPKGAKVVFRALVPCVVVMSACPQDLIKVNDMVPREVEFFVSETGAGAEAEGRPSGISDQP